MNVDSRYDVKPPEPKVGGDYQILSGEKVEDVVVKIYDGDEVIKEISMDAERCNRDSEVHHLRGGYSR